MRLLLPLLLMASLGACATTGDRAGRDPQDPYERFNRGVFAFNQAADKAVIKPATTVYRTVTPVPARRGLSRVFANLLEPLSFVNNMLQGKPRRAFNSLGRFLVNSTIGVGGLADHATGLGLPETSEDYGQTLAVLGAKKSPFLMLPILGPSTVRDAFGTILTFASDPTQIALSEAGATSAEKIAVTATRAIDQRSQLIDSGADALLKGSADPYATVRSAYLQSRDAQIRDQTGSDATLKPEQEQDLLNQTLNEDRGVARDQPSPTLAPEQAPKVVDPEANAPD